MDSDVDESCARYWMTESSSDATGHARSVAHHNRRLFVGFFRRNFTESQLREYFGRYGEIQEVLIMRDGFGVPRGYGFITFTVDSCVDQVLTEKPHSIAGVQLETRRAQSKGASNTPLGPNYHKNKIFIGGLPRSVTKLDVTAFFDSLYSDCPFYKIQEISIPVDPQKKPKGFAFVTFTNEEITDKIVFDNTRAEICGKTCEIKRAEMREDEVLAQAQAEAVAYSLSMQQSQHKKTSSGHYNVDSGENVRQMPSACGLRLLSSSSTPMESRLTSGRIEKMKKMYLNDTNINCGLTSDRSPNAMNNAETTDQAGMKRNLMFRLGMEEENVSSRLDKDTLARVGKIFIDLVSNAINSDGSLAPGNSMQSLLLGTLSQIVFSVKK